MTTGSVIRDRRVTTTLAYKDCYGSTNYRDVRNGAYYKRVHSGGDSPKRTNVPFSTELVNYNLYDAEGRVIGVRTRKLRHYTTPLLTLRQNPYRLSLEERNDMNGWVSIRCSAALSTTEPIDTSGYPCWPRITPLYDSNDQLALIGRLAEKVGAEFNLAVFLGEGREALATIAGVATRIYRAAKEVKKGRVSNAAKILLNGGQSSGGRRARSGAAQATRDFASDWLTLQYGVMPLLRDVESACKHLAYMQNRPFVMKYRVGNRVTWSGERALDRYGSFVGSALEARTIRAHITSINETRLLGLLNPLPVLWEALPASFVFDWFVPVGNFLDALNFRDSLEATYVVTSYDDWRVYGYKQSPYGPVSGVDVPFYVRNLEVKRTVSVQLPVPMPVLKDLRKVASWAHAANAAALLTRFIVR